MDPTVAFVLLLAQSEVQAAMTVAHLINRGA
jgi:hypothetical protein